MKFKSRRLNTGCLIQSEYGTIRCPFFPWPWPRNVIPPPKKSPTRAQAPLMAGTTPRAPCNFQTTSTQTNTNTPIISKQSTANWKTMMVNNYRQFWAARLSRRRLFDLQLSTMAVIKRLHTSMPVSSSKSETSDAAGLGVGSGREVKGDPGPEFTTPDDVGESSAISIMTTRLGQKAKIWAVQWQQLTKITFTVAHSWHLWKNDTWQSWQSEFHTSIWSSSLMLRLAPWFFYIKNGENEAVLFLQNTCNQNTHDWYAWHNYLIPRFCQ